MFRMPMLTMSQWNPNEPPPAALPDGPWLEVALFEWPWTTMLALALVGLAAAWLLQRLGRPRTALAAAGTGLALAGANYAASALMTTDREAVKQQTREAVAAVARGDAAAAEQVLHPAVTLALGSNRTNLTKDQIVARVGRDMTGRYAVRDRAAKISTLRATLDGPHVARVQARIGAVHEATGFPATSWWLFGWRRENGQWRISSMEMQQLEGMPVGTRYDP